MIVNNYNSGCGGCFGYLVGAMILMFIAPYWPLFVLVGLIGVGLFIYMYRKQKHEEQRQLKKEEDIAAYEHDIKMKELRLRELELEEKLNDKKKDKMDWDDF